jgi:hypothetical protein
MNGPFLLVLFLVGYTLNNKEKEEVVNEEVIKEENIFIDTISVKEGE